MNLITAIFGPAPTTATTTDTSADVIRAVIDRMPGIERLSLVRMVYLVQVVHLGRHGQRLLPHWFKATALGVYDEDLSRECRYRISRRSYDRTHAAPYGLSPLAEAVVDEVCEAFRSASPGQLGATTQRPGGAWSKLWEPDPCSSLPISDPRRFRARRKPVDQGPGIDIEHMMLDYDLLIQPESLAA